ncbi:hypothetical protein, partial [Arthrobacter sp. Hiyo1]|uniref:hypothetical protein n=1 Tax=Arthrobacter sp. Hiyo1 TaxID=1588020 RepID=UPI000ABA4952
VVDDERLPLPGSRRDPVQAAQPVQVQAQPVATAAPATAAPQAQPVAQAPAQHTETQEEMIARLIRENAELKDAGSAIGAPAPGNPWADNGQEAEPAGITYRG